MAPGDHHQHSGTTPEGQSKPGGTQLQSVEITQGISDCICEVANGIQLSGDGRKGD